MNWSSECGSAPAMRSARRFPWRRRQPHRRLLPAERLVRARHSGRGNISRSDRSSARAFSPPSRRGWSRPRRWRRSERRKRRGPPATRLRYPIFSTPADQATGALDIDLEVLLLTDGLRSKQLPAHRLSAGNARHLYWTVAQLVAHHASGGCNLRPGDVFGTGTISAPQDDGLGSLLEISAGGRQPVALASGESRRFLEDGDTVIMRAHCRREGFATIGFGECRGTVQPAV